VSPHCGRPECKLQSALAIWQAKPG
jgi:hypothetical protein